ncbi:MAG: hypothetical protein IPO38_00415 [Rhodocyclaceae bacterium]|nr:hypothetical protein [Rhodocyclaceae bacterium]MBP6108675.1 hypothetical protein [Rhodocyclaceae bacterium]
MTNRKVLFKHQLSGACDAMMDIDIDEQGHTINITQRTRRRAGFVSTALLESVIFYFLPREINVRAYHDDDSVSWTPKRISWNVFVHVNDIRFRAECWNQLSTVEPGPPRRCIELYLAPPATITEMSLSNAKQKESNV